MTERPYPDSEHISGQADVFMTELPRLLFESQEKIEELQERVRELEEAELALSRHEEGVLCLIWLIARTMADGGTYMKLAAISEALEEAHRFGAVGGVEPEWLRSARREMGRG